MAGARGATDVVFEARKVSPSRVNALAKCGIAFKLKYVDGVPEETSGSAALFGSVVHDALEHWSPNREQDLLTLMRSAWIRQTEGTAVKDFLAAYAPLSAKAIRKEHEIREAWAAQGKESKAPRMTKLWKESTVAKELDKLQRKWLPKLEANSFWRFTDHDPLATLYDESLVLARRYQAKWGHLPNSLHTEFAFDFEWRGFRLTGYIDAIDPVLKREVGELLAITVTDYKTYKKAPVAELEGDEDGAGAEQKDYRQLVMYDLAVRHLVERGALPLPVSLDEVPLYTGVDYVRVGERRYWEIGEGDYDRLERELTNYAAIVDAQAFNPAEKGSNPDFCPFPSQCCLRSTAAAGGCAKRVEVVL